MAEFTSVLGRAVSMDVAIFDATNYADLAVAVEGGEVDVAWLPPIPLIRVKQRSAVVPLVAHHRDGKPEFHSALIVAAASRFSTLEDLRGSRVAWVDRDSASGYVMPRVALAQQGSDPATFFASETFCHSHESVVRAIADGDVDVGATYAGQDEQGEITRGPWLEPPLGTPMTAMRVIQHFGSIPGDTTAARPGLAPEICERISIELQAMSTDPKSRPLLRKVFGIDEFRPWAASGHEAFGTLAEDALRSGIIGAG